MQEESSKLLGEEAQELVDAIMKTLYSFVDKAMDGRHAATILLDAGLIDEKAVRDISVIRDFDIMFKNPLEKQMEMYYNLSVKYDISVNLVRKIIRERKI